MEKLEGSNKHKKKLKRIINQQEYKERLDSSTLYNQEYKDNFNLTEFNLTEFNKVFEEFELKDVFNDGYGDIMDKTPRVDENINVEVNVKLKNIIDNKNFSLNIFNETFENDFNENVNDELIIYNEPKALPSMSSSDKYRKLEIDKINDFSGSTASAGLKFTDYKQAYSAPKFNPYKVKYKQYKDINDLEAERADISYLMETLDGSNKHEKKFKRIINQQEYVERLNSSTDLDKQEYKDNFNLTEFNKIFEEFKSTDEFNDGYGDIMDKTDGYGDIMDKTPRVDENVNVEVKNIFNNKNFDLNIFNETFKNDLNENINDELIIYNEPKALPSMSGSDKYRELGKYKINDFSGSTASSRLKFTDYKQAYLAPKFNPDKIKYKQYKGINDLEEERANISYNMNEEEREIYEQRQKHEAELEQQRQENIRIRYKE